MNIIHTRFSCMSRKYVRNIWSLCRLTSVIFNINLINFSSSCNTRCDYAIYTSVSSLDDAVCYFARTNVYVCVRARTQRDTYRRIERRRRERETGAEPNVSLSPHLLLFLLVPFFCRDISSVKSILFPSLPKGIILRGYLVSSSLRTSLLLVPSVLHTPLSFRHLLPPSLCPTQK